MLTNEQRAELAYRTRLAFMQYSGSSEADAIVDLLADLMHLANEEGSDFDDELAQARSHYEAELEEEEALCAE